MITNAQKTDRLLTLSKKMYNYQRIVTSDERGLTLDTFIEEAQRSYPHHKPEGLWFAFGKHWIHFLHRQGDKSWGQARLNSISNVYQLYLQGNVLRIYTLKEFDKFEKKYANKKRTGIHWEPVADKYDGIEIRYQPARGNDSDDDYWYDSWDLSSGVVWNKAGIKKIKLLKSWQLFWREN